MDTLKAYITIRAVRVGIDGCLSRIRWEVQDEKGKTVDFGIAKDDKAALAAAHASLAKVQS